MNELIVADQRIKRGRGTQFAGVNPLALTKL
jgi:hypothetical protein